MDYERFKLLSPCLIIFKHAKTGAPRIKQHHISFFCIFFCQFRRTLHAGGYFNLAFRIIYLNQVMLYFFTSLAVKQYYCFYFFLKNFFPKLEKTKTLPPPPRNQNTGRPKASRPPLARWGRGRKTVFK